MQSVACFVKRKITHVTGGMECTCFSFYMKIVMVMSGCWVNPLVCLLRKLSLYWRAIHVLIYEPSR